MTTESGNHATHEPSPQEVRQLAKLFKAVADRIEDRLQHVQDVPSLIRDMIGVYSVEAGRHFCRCLERNALPDFREYYQHGCDWQDLQRSEKRPDGRIVDCTDYHAMFVAAQQACIADLWLLIEASSRLDPSECPDKEREINALYAVVWFKAVRGWLLGHWSQRFRPDAMSLFLPATEAQDVHRLSIELPGGQRAPAGAFTLIETEILRRREKGCDEVYPGIFSIGEIHVAACRLLAEVLDDEAAELELQAGEFTGEPDANCNIFRRNGDFWELRFNSSEVVRFEDRKGFQIIAKLLQAPNPQKPIPAIDLMGGDSRLAVEFQPGQPVLDEDARREYKKDLADYDREITEANEQGDEPKAGRLVQERQEVINRFTEATGLGGRPRHLGPGSSADSARVAVRRNIDRAVTAIEKSQPRPHGMAEHLRSSIRPEGNAYAYRPSPPVNWNFS